MMKRILSSLLAAALVVLVLTLAGCSSPVTRETRDFNEGWAFMAGDVDEASNPGYDDSAWRMLNLPHDWSIEGSFGKDNPATPGGGALPGGIGWYRKSFTMSGAEKERMHYIEFDGIYRNGEVWINGSFLGRRPYGYSSFRYNLTPYLVFGDSANVIAVKVDNSLQPNSRWYSGSGIYRNVRLVSTTETAVDHWGTFITTPVVSTGKAVINVVTTIRNTSGEEERVNVIMTLYDADNKKAVSVKSKDISLTDTLTVVTQEAELQRPRLWSLADPCLYKVIIDIEKDGVPADRYETVTGIRSFAFDSEKGFFLNGEAVKILGVCNHHDLGCLGAAINTRAVERQLEILKEMGCNAIRTSHNPPAPELLDLCDRMGFIVMDEAFDMWKISKTKYDYSMDWDEWHERDLTDMIKRDRNHPSVFMWSIGNEIMEQWDTTGTGTVMAAELAAMVQALDTTRPVTTALNDPFPWDPLYKSGVFDLVGYNYHDSSFAGFHKYFPGKKFIASETTSALATRGSYDMPSDEIRRWPRRWDLPFNEGNADYSCSAYDNCSAPWGTTHEESWRLIKKYDYLSGMFIWTGFDYLGEPTPYWWPARSSYFGIVDLAGFPKDAYYMYQSQWTNTPVLHIFPHWNWKEGDVVDVWAYTNCDEVELLLNDISLGIKQMNDTIFHLSWRVRYEPGTITASGRKDGKEIMRQEVKTAGDPAAIMLSPDRSEISADGKDLSFVTVTVVDKDGVTVPYAANMVNFTVTGNATIAGVDNGSQVSMEPFKADHRKAFHGKCLVVVQAGKERGEVMLVAASDGLSSAETKIVLQ